ncbi:SRPBCC domain-containing protein [Streptomyces amakusaensis]|uniref:SRPBCC family protein n=1 Tax=Streptomyces amakusaensis TaxID=67271 RepID=A0ABW0AR01_9ACTN
MDHEVFVPVPAETVRQVLRDPARVARCVHGLQQDADGTAGPLSGRLKVRVGGHSITYRGALRLLERDGGFTAEGEGTEARGGGTVRVTLTIRLTEADGGTNLSVTGSAEPAGRLAELSAGAREETAHRLLDRLGERLAEEAARGTAGEAEPPGFEGPGPVSGADAERLGITGEDGDEGEDGTASVFDTPVPPSSLSADADADTDADGFGGASELDDLEGLADLSKFSEELPEELPDALPAEAAHARRTMIGRSAEEVDHAPPRGRYAPVPAPDATATGLPLRWVAPAAALALASAVVVGRALRRRK